MDEACKRLEDAGADVVGPQLLARAGDDAAAARSRSAARSRCRMSRRCRCPIAPRRSSRPSSRCATRALHLHSGRRPFPVALDPFTCNRFEIAEFAQGRSRHGHALSRRVLRRRPASHPRARRGARAHARRRAAIRPTCRSHSYFGNAKGLRAQHLRDAGQLRHRTGAT